MPADLTREKIERIDDEYQHTGWVSLADAVRLLQHALSEPERIAAARAEAHEEGAQEVHAAHIRHHDRIRKVMGLDLHVGNHDWRHNPAYLIDTTDLRDAYDTLVVLIGEQTSQRERAARAEGYREGVEACAVWLETQAAAFLDARDQHMRACEATKGGSLAEEMHSRRACSAEATAASLSEAAAGLRRLCPPSAKPDAAVAEVGSDK